MGPAHPVTRSLSKAGSLGMAEVHAAMRDRRESQASNPARGGGADAGSCVWSPTVCLPLLLLSSPSSPIFSFSASSPLDRPPLSPLSPPARCSTSTRLLLPSSTRLTPSITATDTPHLITANTFIAISISIRMSHHRHHHHRHRSILHPASSLLLSLLLLHPLPRTCRTMARRPLSATMPTR